MTTTNVDLLVKRLDDAQHRYWTAMKELAMAESGYFEAVRLIRQRVLWDNAQHPVCINPNDPACTCGVPNSFQGNADEIS